MCHMLPHMPPAASHVGVTQGEAGFEFVWELVGQAITAGDRLLVHLLVDCLCRTFPSALLHCPWR